MSTATDNAIPTWGEINKFGYLKINYPIKPGQYGIASYIDKQYIVARNDYFNPKMGNPIMGTMGLYYAQEEITLHSFCNVCDNVYDVIGIPNFTEPKKIEFMSDNAYVTYKDIWFQFINETQCKYSITITNDTIVYGDDAYIVVNFFTFM